MKVVVFLTSLALLFVCFVAPYAAETFTVNPTQQWQATGFLVSEGDCVDITATGIICTSGCYPDAQHDPTGCCPYVPGSCENWGSNPDQIAGSGYLVPGVFRYSLVGRISGGTPFYVGPDLQFVASASGELELAFNDDYYYDNDGEFIATIGLCGVIPTLTEWGLIIFGVFLAVWMTWVVLHRRKRAIISN
jgi:hypothetical protein